MTHARAASRSGARLTAVMLMLACVAPAGALAAQQQPGRMLRDVDVRARDSGPVAPSALRARAALESALGDEGVVSTDRVSGAARLVARSDGFLTSAGGGDPVDVALGYVRSHAGAFGLDAADLAALRLTSRYRSPGGATHLAYTQTHAGVASYDNVLFANVDRDGRLLNVGGSAVSDLAVESVRPAIAAAQALATAKASAGGTLLAPRAQEGPGPERPTRFSSGDRARLTIFADGRTERLAWRIEVEGERGHLYEVVIDATTGAVLARRSLTAFVSSASVHEYHPGAASGGTPHAVDLDADRSWLDRSDGYTRLRGNNAHAYADTNGIDGFDAREDVAPSAGDDWVYPQTPFDVAGQRCPLVGGRPGCTWDSTPGSEATKAANREQATTQLFYFVNTFHDHLEAPPIGFTHAARNFEFSDADGGGAGRGADPVLAESNDSSGLDNASMQTSADGTSPKLQMHFFTAPPLNGADAADVVYHEYAHGLTNRSVGTGAGLTANQSRALGEGWSDWYALDYLAGQGHVVDGPANGELQIGAHLIPGGFRWQGADCPVGAPAPACPGAPGAGPGGFTLADLGTFGTPFHLQDNGEIWLETLWDIRRALGSPTARAIVTEGLRLAPNDPSFLEARDAIIMADRQTGGASYTTLWRLFAARGMGYGAETTSSAATSAVAAFDMPPAVAHDATGVADPLPGGDGDGAAEPGETVLVTEVLRNVNPFAVGGAVGRLSPGSGGVAVVGADATWQPFAAGATRPGTPAFRVAIGRSASCGRPVGLSLALSGDTGASTLALTIPTGTLGAASLSTDVPKAIPGRPGVESKLTFATPGTVDAMKVRIPRLTHGFVGDLAMTLRSPQGTTVTLMSQPGAGVNGAPGDDFADLLLDDDAPAAIDTIPDASPGGGYTGSFRPDEPLSAFDGQNRLGTWTLTVSDAFVPEDAGMLGAWGLVPTGRVCSVTHNASPAARDDAYAAVESTPLDAASVLGNDSDPEGSPLSALTLTRPQHGELSLAANGTFRYTPAAGFRGRDWFTYGAYDAAALSAAATVAIDVAGADLPPPAGSPAPPVMPAPRSPPGPPARVPSPLPAKLEVLRAAVKNGRLDVLAQITARAAGRVTVTYRSAGVTTRFTAAVARGRIRVGRLLPALQRRRSSGIVTLTYAGAPGVQADEVTLRAAAGKARLMRRQARIDARGRLRVSGTISRRARGVVRVRLGYATPGGAAATFLTYSAPIAAGAWSLSQALPRDAAAAGGQLSIQFTGYAPAGIRGEQDSKEVRPAG